MTDSNSSAPLATNALPAKAALRAPCVAVALATSVGITADRFLCLDPALLGLLLLTLLGIWCVTAKLRSERLGVVCLLVFLATAGAAHHHRHWFDRPENDVEHLLSSERRLLRVRGRVVGFPTTLLREGDCIEPGRTLPPITRFTIDVAEVKCLEDWSSKSGCLRVDLRGVVVLAPGELVEVQGWAQTFRGPANPGEPDYRLGQQALRVRGTLKPSNGNLIKADAASRSWLSAARQRLRAQCDATLRSQLRGDSLATALAFLLGDRSLLSNQVRNDFIETGTMHVLAISGVHITVLGMFVATVCRVLGRGRRTTVLVVLLVSAAYLAIADVRPPMTRAFVLIVVWATEQWMFRRALSFNSLALAAIVIQVLNPTDLFDVGAQLSFLAVATMIWWARMELRWMPWLVDKDPSSELPSSLLAKRFKATWRLAVRSFVLSFVIWLVTVPLVAVTFHVVSPIGPFINVPLAVVASPALRVGFVFVMASMVHPSAAALLGGLLDGLLKAMLVIVHAAAEVPYGHAYVPAPPDWWLWCSYGVIAVLMLTWLVQRRSRWLLAGAVAWSLFGASLALRPVPQHGLRCTFLSVGHGCSVLIETPRGQVVVYDVGCISAGEFAKRTLSQALWHRHRREIDALIVSHADADHFNGVRGLLEVVSARRLFVNQAFFETSQLGAVDALNAARASGLSIETVCQDDVINIDDTCELRVLHPTRSATYESDNAGSVVLELLFAGRRVVLTGDIGGSGLRQLLQQPPRPIDVLMAPHHGSLNDNPIELVQWARPKWIVASAGRNVALARLQERYGENARVLATSTAGAVEFSIAPSGEIAVRTYGQDE